MPEHVRIVVDSSVCLEPAAAAEMGITVVPMRISIDGVEFRDTVDISAEGFYRKMREGSSSLSTSAPTAGDYLEAFKGAPGKVLCLVAARSVTSMRDAAGAAASVLPQGRVLVVDSGAAAGGLRLLALDAAHRAMLGEKLEQIAARVETLAARVRTYGALESLEWLARGGRVPQVAEWVSGLLSVRPLIEFKQGRARLAQLVRTRRSALQALERILQQRADAENAGPQGERLHCTVIHADAAAEAEELHAWLRLNFPRADLSVSAFTPAMGAHTGPGVIGHAFFVEPA